MQHRERLADPQRPRAIEPGRDEDASEQRAESQQTREQGEAVRDREPQAHQQHQSDPEPETAP